VNCKECTVCKEFRKKTYPASRLKQYNPLAEIKHTLGKYLNKIPTLSTFQSKLLLYRNYVFVLDLFHILWYQPVLGFTECI
jgi:hypothetical protein